MFDALIIRVLNHLLSSASWARERLRAHAGAQMRIRTGGLELGLAIDGAGYFCPAPGGEPAVTILLPDDAPWRLLGDRASVFQAARLSGAADVAETLAFVFRNLSWDVEGDLAQVVGDIPARRLEMLRKGISRRIGDAAQRLVGNLTEYASEDGAWIAPRRDMQALAADVAILQAEVESLEKRLAAL